tara:strand:+ start:18325 stop:18882 length:558 start_codon:yes stop_codon:yes gene_type:complete
MYKYIKNHDWDTPINYSYCRYEGRKFIQAFFDSRKDSINFLDKVINQSNIKYNFSNLSNDIKEGTQTILSNILKDIKSGINVLDKLNFFVMKFEINKRIYEIYNNKSKKGEGDFSNVINYILLSVCCLEFYYRCRKIKFLNTSLKINDIIIARFRKEENTFYYNIFREMLVLEQRCVEKVLEEVL